VRRAGAWDLVGLLTTVTEGFDRVSMHGVREEILDLQADRVGLPCLKVRIPPRCTNADYERAMGEAISLSRGRGVTHVVFGDLFLEDVRRYREERLAGSGIEPVFPLWGRDTTELASEMITAGLRAVVVCVDPRALPGSFAGRWFDSRFLQDLPESVDPCGEKGEFHTCVTAGPMFQSPVFVRPGEILVREGFLFADLLTDLAGGVPEKRQPVSP
jgi:uncharacterized protein (TIGR00290 family)